MNFLPTPKIIQGLPPTLTEFDKVAIDMELFGLKQKQLHRPAGEFGSLACTVDGETTYILYDPKGVTEFLKNISEAVWIGHNIAFDLGHLRRWTDLKVHPRCWDTLLIEKILYNGYYDNGQFTLADLLRRHCDTYLSKDMQKSFKGKAEWTQEQIDYAAKDPIATWQVYWKQKELVSKNDLWLYKHIDLPTMWLTLGFTGAKINVEKWLTLCQENQAIAKDLEKELGFNPGSTKQTKAALLEEGIEAESTGKKALGHLADENEMVKNVFECRTYKKRVSTYGEAWVNTFVEEDGRVYAAWKVSEAKTNRMSCTSPNLQNIPVRETPEYRKCFIAGEKKVYVIADWGAQEPRLAAHLSDERKLIDIFNSGKDVYIQIAKEMFNEEITKKDPRRKDIKEIVIGSCNGLTEYGLSKKIGKSPDECVELMDLYFEKFPNLFEYREEIKNSRPPYVETINGRKIWLNQYVYGWERTGMDAPIQGSAAEAMKLAMAEFCTQWGCDFLHNPIVLPVHDEIVLEVPEERGEEAKQLLEKVMVETAESMHPEIKAKVEIVIGKNWGDKQ